MEEVESFLLLADRLLVNANVLAVSAQAARIKRRCTVAIADSAIVVRVVASLRGAEGVRQRALKLDQDYPET